MELVVSPEKLHEEVEAGRVALLLSRLLGEAQHLLSHLDGGQEDEKQKVDKDKATDKSENNSQDEGENKTKRMRTETRKRTRAKSGCV